MYRDIINLLYGCLISRNSLFNFWLVHQSVTIPKKNYISNKQLLAFLNCLLPRKLLLLRMLRVNFSPFTHQVSLFWQQSCWLSWEVPQSRITIPTKMGRMKQIQARMQLIPNALDTQKFFIINFIIASQLVFCL